MRKIFSLWTFLISSPIIIWSVYAQRKQPEFEDLYSFFTDTETAVIMIVTGLGLGVLLGLIVGLVRRLFIMIFIQGR